MLGEFHFISHDQMAAKTSVEGKRGSESQLEEAAATQFGPKQHLACVTLGTSPPAKERRATKKETTNDERANPPAPVPPLSL